MKLFRYITILMCATSLSASDEPIATPLYCKDYLNVCTQANIPHPCSDWCSKEQLKRWCSGKEGPPPPPKICSYLLKQRNNEDTRDLRHHENLQSH